MVQIPKFTTQGPKSEAHGPRSKAMDEGSRRSVMEARRGTLGMCRGSTSCLDSCRRGRKVGQHSQHRVGYEVEGNTIFTSQDRDCLRLNSDLQRGRGARSYNHGHAHVYWGHLEYSTDYAVLRPSRNRFVPSDASPMAITILFS